MADDQTQTLAPSDGDVVGRLRRLRPGTDFEALLAEFRAGPAPHHADAFVAWLLERGAIEAEDAASWHVGTRIEVHGSERSTAADTADGGEERAPADADAPRETPGRYLILHSLGTGAMGTVHVAKDMTLGRRVALKQMRKRAVKKGQLPRFVREMQITSQLEHPHIVPLYAFEEGYFEAPAYSMKLVEGRDLSQLVTEARERISQGQPLDHAHSVHTRLEIFLKICDAVHYAHSKGVIHRDLKPANVRVGRHNEVYVLDWGVARLIDDPDLDASEAQRDDDSVDLSGSDSWGMATRAGSLIGTPAYMAPEQARGEEVDALSDQFSLGLILYELVCLKRAYPRPKGPMRRAMERIGRGEYDPIQHVERTRALPADLVAIIQRALAARPEDRYPSVAALADDVRSFLRGQETQARPDNGPRRLRRWVRAHRTWVVGTLLPLALLLPVVAALAISAWSAHDNGQETVATVTAALRSEIGARIETRLESFLGEPEQVNKSISAAIRLGQLDLEDLRSWRMALLAQLQLHPSVAYVGMGFEDGDYVGLERELSGRLVFELKDATTKDEAVDFVMSPEGVVGARVRTEHEFDPRVRPWYTVAATAGAQRWSAPYVYTNHPTLALTLSHPVKDARGKLLGVFGSDRTLNMISDFLQQVEVGRSGRAYIVERSGSVIGASVGLPDVIRRVTPVELEDPLITETDDHLRSHFGDYGRVGEAEELIYEGSVGRVHVLVRPYRDPRGLDWVIVIAMPEADFMEYVEANTRSVLNVGLVALALAAMLGVVAALWIRRRAYER